MKKKYLILPSMIIGALTINAIVCIIICKLLN